MRPLLVPHHIPSTPVRPGYMGLLIRGCKAVMPSPSHPTPSVCFGLYAVPTLIRSAPSSLRLFVLRGGGSLSLYLPLQPPLLPNPTAALGVDLSLPGYISPLRFLKLQSSPHHTCSSATSHHSLPLQVFAYILASCSSTTYTSILITLLFEKQTTTNNHIIIHPLDDTSFTLSQLAHISSPGTDTLTSPCVTN